MASDCSEITTTIFGTKENSCYKGCYRLRMNNAGVYNNLKENEAFEGQITLMDEDTDWNVVEW